MLPGVTVEAASPALIEKVRAATTDDQGQYKIVDLRPGTYSVTFGLTGFNTVKRDGIEVSSGFTANLAIEMRVGAMEETITVTGSSPLVDVQNTRQQTVMTREVIDTIPTGKTAQNFAVLVPGCRRGHRGQRADGAGRRRQRGRQAGRVDRARLAQSGDAAALRRHALQQHERDCGRQPRHLDHQHRHACRRYTVEVGALSAEADVSGVRQNVIPKAGGNVFRGSFFGNYTNDALTSTSNVSNPALVTLNEKIWDLNPTMGGPIIRDKLWFFGAYRYWGNDERPPGAYYDTNPSDNVYTPDLNRPTINENWNHSEDFRLTWQASARHKFSLWADDLQRCTCHWFAAPPASG